MKNLKKILSLTLALAMALSLMTTALAADAGDFTDYGDVTYTEAVDVMTAVGVFNGVGSGSNFDPNGTLTREQAAKIITYMVMGQTQADKLVATIAPFADVSADRWSAGAIAYCASEGIMNGTGNGKFNPTGELTGLQFAKMLLVAIGYDAELEKMTGAAWGLATSKLAYAVELDDGMDDINLTVPMTREQAAQMAFTTMKTPLVEYADKGATISVNGAVVEFGAQKAQYVSVEKTDGTNNAGKIDTATLANGWTLIEFGERYCKDLEKVHTTNSLEQPVRKWTYKNETIGKYAIGEEKVVVVAERDKTLDDVLTGKSYMNYSSSDLSAVRVNDGTEESPSYNYNAYLNGDQLGSGYRTTNLHKGDVVYAYENSNGKVDRVVIARYTLAKIDSVTDKLNTTESEAGADYRVKLVDLSDSSIHNSNYYNDHSNSNYIINGFASGTYTEGTVLAVAVNPDGGEIADSYVAEIVTGKPTAVKENDNGDITIDGTRYPFIARSGDASIIPDGETSGFDFDNEYAVYTTKEGYVIGIEGVTSANVDNLYYVTGIYVKASSFGESNKEYYAQRVSLADGSTDTVRVEKGSVQAIYNDAALDVASAHSPATTCTNGTICTDITHTKCTQYAGLYTFNDKRVAAGGVSVEQKAGNDILTMVKFIDDSVITKDFSATRDGVVGTAAVNGTVDADATRLTVNNATGSSQRTFYLNEETKFLAVEAKGSDLDVTYATGSMKVTTNNAPAIVVYDKDDARTAIAVLYVADSLNVSTFTKDVVYLASQPTRKNSNDTWEATLYEMNDGGKTTRDVRLDDNYVQGFYHFSEKSDGSLKLTSIADLSLSSAYDDETGPIVDVTINDVYKTTLFSAGTTHIQNVNFNGVTIIDNRTASQMLGDDYTTSITSVSDLKRATDDGCVVIADVYFDNGATFIAVDDATKNPTADLTNFTLTVPSPNASNKIVEASKTVTINLESDKTAATFTVNKGAAQRIAIGGDYAAKVTGTNHDNANTTATFAIADLTANSTKTFTLTVSEAGAADKVYTVNVVVAKGVQTMSGADMKTALQDGTLEENANVKTTDAVAFDGAAEIPTGATVEIEGAITGGNNLTVKGTLTAGSTVDDVKMAGGTLNATGAVTALTVTEGTTNAVTADVTTVTNVAAGAEATITGSVGTVTDVEATGKLTIDGAVGTTITDNHGTLIVTGNVELIENNNGTLTVGEAPNPASIRAGAVTVGDIQGNAATGTITVYGDVTTLTDMNGTVTITGNVTTFTNMAGGTLNLGGTAEIAEGTTTSVAGTIAIGANGELKVTQTTDTEVSIAGVTFNGVDGATVTLAGGDAVAITPDETKHKLYDGSTAVTNFAEAGPVSFIFDTDKFVKDNG